MKLKFLTLSIISCSLSTAGTVYAQASSTSQNKVNQGYALEEVVVSATRRITDAQTTAASVSALGADWLSDRSVQSVEQIADVTPGLHIGAYQGDTSIFIRGIGTPVIIAGNDSSTAAYLDGVYLSRAAATGPAFFDIEQIEVLRGPQGTLYGRNATSGALKINTKKATEELSGEARLSLGNYNRRQFFGAISGSLADGIRARAAIQTEKRDGYTTVTNQANESFDAEDKDDIAVRLRLEADLSDDATLTLIGDYYEADDRANVFHYASAGYADELGPSWYNSREGSQTLAYFGIKNTG